MKRTSYYSALLLALAAPAAAQTAPTTPAPGAPAGSPAAVPASTAAQPPAVAPPTDPAVTPPTDPAMTPTEPVTPVVPVEPAPPPPPPAPKFTGLMASNATDQHLARHDLALDKETTLPDHPFTGFVFGDYWFTSGPRLGVTAGVFRAFELHLGVLLDSKTTMPAMVGGPTTSSSSTRFFYGGSVGLLSLYGIQLAGGLTALLGDGDTSDIVPNATLSLPLDAHWLPFHIEKTRVRITYPVGIGIEWGNL